jgi:hypothetical protein
LQVRRINEKIRNETLCDGRMDGKFLPLSYEVIIFAQDK